MHAAAVVRSLDRVGHGRGRDRRVRTGVGAQRRDRALEQPGAHAAGVRRRAPGRSRTRPAAASAIATDSERQLPPVDAVTPAGAAAPGGQRDDDPRRSPACARTASRLQSQQRASRQLDERLRASCAEALAAAGGDDQCDCHGEGGFRARGKRARSLLPRAREPRYLAPATAIWLLAESASSSSR